jgi:hypothetical protein
MDFNVRIAINSILKFIVVDLSMNEMVIKE